VKSIVRGAQGNERPLDHLLGILVRARLDGLRYQSFLFRSKSNRHACLCAFLVGLFVPGRPATIPASPAPAITMRGCFAATPGVSVRKEAKPKR